MSRQTRCVVLLTALMGALPVAADQRSSRPAARSLTTYKTTTCGCCAKWVDYMESHGFTATVHDMPDVGPVKDQKGVPTELRSCHTSIVGGYVIEGHVPFEDVQRLLRERPNVVGLAAPGMPPGSPGMDMPNSPPYDVLTFDKTGRTAAFAKHGTPSPK